MILVLYCAFWITGCRWWNVWLLAQSVNFWVFRGMISGLLQIGKPLVGVEASWSMCCGKPIEWILTWEDMGTLQASIVMLGSWYWWLAVLFGKIKLWEYSGSSHDQFELFGVRSWSFHFQVHVLLGLMQYGDNYLKKNLILVMDFW